MLVESLPTFIENLPIPEPAAKEAATASPVDITNLPDGVICGSTMIGFDAGLSSDLRTSVALCLTAAQKVAKADSVVASPDLWVDRHDMVLRGLNWISTTGGELRTERNLTNVSVHKAIIPFLTAAFGPASTAASLIVTAIEQLRKMDEEKPWITLFESESRRFDVSEFRFATAGAENGTVVLRFAAARFVARQERMQILFFKKNDIEIDFKLASRTMTANPELLKSMNAALQEKLQNQTDDFIAGLDF